MLSNLDMRLLRGSLKEREAEAKRQGVFEVWETKVRRDQESSRLEAIRALATRLVDSRKISDRAISRRLFTILDGPPSQNTKETA